mmetsp:Transcript_29391/g.35788  ORF Transcript_29391/g.35788 Transcript_29391/m.35788 type:complete len:390 (+) Transcript_29391:243-1412(+)
MYPLGQNNTSTFGANNTRRAFKDVTNASNSNSNIRDEPLPLKRKNAVLPSRSQLQVGHNNSTTNPSRQHKHVKSNVRTDNGCLPREKNASQPSLSQRVNNYEFSRQTSFRSTSSRSYQHSAPADNIDERDVDDPLCATDYVEDMYDSFRLKETSTAVCPGYMAKQSHINERMRSILVDWLVEVHLKFKLVPETLYLTVKLIDRYLQVREVSRPKLQLVGVTCLLIASKYEEIYPPELRDLVYICDRAYSNNDILEMEETVLKALEYRVTTPSAHTFLVRFLKAAHADKKMVQLSCYILDGTLQSYKLLQCLPSELAAAAVLIARRCIGRNSWSPTLLKYAKYREEDVIPVARAVLSEKANASTELRAVVKKYTSSRYGSVANTVLECDF